MELINSFVPDLFAVRYPHESKDELERVFDQWNNSESLFEFFEQNIKDINIPIEMAIEKVRIEARYLRDKLIKLASQKPSQLDAIFKNLKIDDILRGYQEYIDQQIEDILREMENFITIERCFIN